MNTLWQELRKDLRKVKCNECGSTENLWQMPDYMLDDTEILCKNCLETLEYEE